MNKIELADKSLMMIFLLEECNYGCCHCVRDDEPMVSGYKLTFQQLQQCLVDCQSLKSVSWVHFSGGEPTLWRDGEHSLLDLILEISKAGFSPGFTTNGSSFLNFDRCNDFIKGYTNNSSIPLILYISIDSFHKNFNAVTGKSQSLDNVVRSIQKLPTDKRELVDLRVAAAISKETKSLLPETMVKHYESLGVDFRFSPLRSVGKAKSMRDICPDVDSENSSDLGAYNRFHKIQDLGKQDKKVSVILIDNDYWVSVNDNYEFARKWKKVSSLGNLSTQVQLAYSSM